MFVVATFPFEMYWEKLRQQLFQGFSAYCCHGRLSVEISIRKRGSPFIEHTTYILKLR